MQLAQANLIFGLHYVESESGISHSRHGQALFSATSTRSRQTRRSGWDTTPAWVIGSKCSAFSAAGIPDAFRSLSECEVSAAPGQDRFIDNPKNLVGHPAPSFFGTLEMRVCDHNRGWTYARARGIDERSSRSFKVLRKTRPASIAAGFWMRIAGGPRVTDRGQADRFGREAEVETRSLINELLEFVSTGSRNWATNARWRISRIMREGGADRQLAVFHGMT